MTNLHQLGERGLLALLRIYMGKNIRVPAGDDGAVLALPAGELVATTDLLFDEVHFSDITTTAYDVGWRAATANLSDLAAMGATAVGTLIGLGLPQDTPVAWVQDLYAGFTACADPWGGDHLRGRYLPREASNYRRHCLRDRRSYKDFAPQCCPTGRCFGDYGASWWFEGWS